MNKSKYKNIILLIIFLLQSLPLLWLLITSFRIETGLFTWSNENITKELTFINYIRLFKKYDFILWLRNSFIISITASLIATVFGWFFSLSIQMFVPDFFKKLRALVLIAYLIPSMFLILSLQHILDNITGFFILFALSICYQFFLLPIAIWISGSYISQIPNSLIAISCLDGINLINRIKFLILPFVKNGIFSVFLLCFILSFQEYLYALVFLKNEKFITIPLGLTSLQAGDIYNWGIIASAAIVTTLLILSLLLIFGNKLSAVFRQVVSN